MKKGKRLLALLLATAVFGAGAYLLNLNTKQQEAAKTAAKEAEKTVLLTLDADKATALSYTRKGESIDLAKQNGAWAYAPRSTFALDTAKVTAMLDSLKRVEAVRGVTDQSDSLADYGLTQPALRITADAEGGATQTLLIGDKNAMTGDYYAAVAGKDGVYTITSDVYNAFDQGLMQLLTAEDYPTVDAAAVTGITLRDASGQTALEYHENGDPSAYSSAFQWFAKGADGSLTPVNPDAVDTYLNTATAVTYAGTAADTKADLAAYGLDAPKLLLTLRYTENVSESQAAALMAADAAAQAALPSVAPAATPVASPSPLPAATQASKTIATAIPAPTAAPTATPASTAGMATAAAPTATPAATLSGSTGAAIAEAADAVPTASTEPTATPEPAVPVERTLTLLFGGTDADGNVYMTHTQTDRVFTIGADTFQALTGLTAESLKANRPAYLSLLDITGMTATMGDQTKTVTAQAVTEAASDGTQTVKTVYRIDGKDVKPAAFNLLVSNLKAIKAEGYTDKPVATNAAPVFHATFTQSRAGFETLDVAFYPYDASFLQAVTNGDSTMLVNKQDVARLQTYMDGLVAAETTATPEPGQTATPAG